MLKCDGNVLINGLVPSINHYQPLFLAASNVYLDYRCVGVHCKKKTVKITNLVVSTVARI